MAEADGASDQKEFDPTPRKLQKAREEGDVVKSEDIQAAISGLGVIIAGVVLGAWSLQAAGQAARNLLAFSGQMRLSSSGGSDGVIFGLAVQSAAPIIALTLVPMAMVVIWLIASRGLVFAPSKLQLKGSRLSIIKNFGQKFGRAGLVDFLKRSLKMLLISACLTMYLMSYVDDLFRSALLEPGQVVLLLFRMILGFLCVVLVLNVVFGVVDYIWQRAEFMRRHRMSRKEMMDEVKDSEGDPHLKADRRRRAEAVSRRKMLADVPMADVIIVNPTHYAVALKWQREKKRAPICVAKGVDEIAARIREIAQESGVPIRRDPPTARKLYKMLDIGQEILPEHYAAVAAAIRFANAMRSKMRSSRKLWEQKR